MWTLKGLFLLLILNYLEKPKWTGASDLSSNFNRNQDLDWMETETLGMVQGGQWSRYSVCPAGSFVTGYRIKYGQGDNKGEVTGLSLKCSELDENYKLQQAGILNSNGATFNTAKKMDDSITVDSNRYAVGFSMARWTDAEDFEYVGPRAITFYGEDFLSKMLLPEGTKAARVANLKCPDGWGICGVQARESESRSESDNQGVLTKLRFKCCYYCIPQEVRVVLDDFTNPGSTEYTRTIRTTTGIQVDQRYSRSGSNSVDLDWTKELQTGNSESLSNSTTENQGDTFGSTTGNRNTDGWLVNQDLRVSTSSQILQDKRKSDSRTNTDTDSRTTGKSKTKTDSSHWSKRKESSTSVTKGSEIGASLTASASGGFGPFFSASVEASASFKTSNSHTTQNTQEDVEGGGTGNEEREHQEDTRQTVKGTTIENQFGESQGSSNGQEEGTSSGITGDITTNEEESRTKSIQRAREQSIQQGAQSSFTKRHNNRESWQKNWEVSGSSMWREEREDTQTFTCEEMARCKIEQLYFTCGALRIGTNKIEKKIDRLIYGQNGITPTPAPVLNNSSNPKETQWEISVPGETWVVAKDFSFWEPSGQWEKSVVCPPSKIVTGHSFKYLSGAGLTGIRLFCSWKHGPDEGDEEHKNATMLPIYYKDEPEKNKTRGYWGTVYRGSRSTFAQGFIFLQVEINGSRFKGNHEMIYHNIEPMKIPNELAINSSHVEIKCPVDHAICGLTAMMDGSGVGILTAIGLKCCHHCIPEEKWVEVTSWDKTGPSEEKRQVTTTTGIHRTSSTVQSRSNQIGNTVDSAGIREGFSARFGLSNSTGFDWTHTSTAMWSEEKQITDTYICEPYSKCVYKELVGQCGSVRIHANKFSKESTPLVPVVPDTQLQLTSTISTEPEPEIKQEPEPEQQGLADYLVRLDGEETPVEVLKNGEIWIEARSIQGRIGSGAESQQEKWGSSKSCPLGTFVTGYKFQYYGGVNKDTQYLIQEISLQCSRWNELGEFQQVAFIPGDPSQRRGQGLGQSSGQDENWSNLIQDEHETLGPAVGFHYFVYEWANENGELEQGTTLPDLLFYREQTPNAPKFPNTDGEINSLPQKILCPKDYVICGVGARKEGSTGILLDVKFRCCYHCEPYEEMKELDRRQNPTDSQIFYTIERVSVGAAVQVKNPLEEGRTAHTFTLLPGFSDYEYIQHMFSHRLPRRPKSKSSSPSRVNCRQGEDLWTKEIETSIGSHCPPQHKCAVNRIIGRCGPFRIRTPITYTLSKLITDSSSFEDQEE